MQFTNISILVFLFPQISSLEHTIIDDYYCISILSTIIVIGYFLYK